MSNTTNTRIIYVVHLKDAPPIIFEGEQDALCILAVMGVGYELSKYSVDITELDQAEETE